MTGTATGNFGTSGFVFGGTLGANAVAKAAPDGYTLLMGGNTTHSAAPAFFKSVPYDPVKDFTPIARIGKFASVVTTNAAQPFRTIQEFATFATANPGKRRARSNAYSSLPTTSR